MAKKRGQPEKEEYIPIYPEKYQGQYPIIARSSWETDFMTFLDHNPSVLEWASEPCFNGQRGIPYQCPLSGKQTIYIPDFLVKFVDAGGRTQIKLIEIKPMHEAIYEYCRNAKDEAVYHKNVAKWTAARSWCERRGIEFMVITEQQLYTNHDNRKPPVRKPETPKPAAKKPGRKRKA